jgi:hypothetical protein
VMNGRLRMWREFAVAFQFVLHSCGVCVEISAVAAARSIRTIRVPQWGPG